MKGEPIESVNNGLESMLAFLRKDPFALESVYLSIITFDREVKMVLPLTELESVQLPKITTPDSGPTHLGEALEVLCQTVDREIITNTPEHKGDWMPLLFIMTDGSASDIQKFKQQVPEVKRRNFGNIIGCSAGPKAKDADLKELTTNVVHLDTTDSATFRQFFKWVSNTVSIGNRSMGAGDGISLPPPPPEIDIFFSNSDKELVATPANRPQESIAPISSQLKAFYEFSSEKPEEITLLDLGIGPVMLNITVKNAKNWSYFKLINGNGKSIGKETCTTEGNFSKVYIFKIGQKDVGPYAVHIDCPGQWVVKITGVKP
jgi:uncharacterized protein YegL